MSARKRSTQSLASILAAADGGLGPLFARSHHLRSLNELLRGALGDPLGPHVRLCNIRADVAVVAADSPAWLTQLRFQAPVILHILQSHVGMEGLRKVQFKVQPPTEPAAHAAPPRRATLSPCGARTLTSAAEGIQDPELSEALRRLARNAANED